jgi:hypothetical protein
MALGARNCVEWDTVAEILGRIERIRLDSVFEPKLVYTLTGAFMHFRLSSARATFAAASALGCLLTACLGIPQAQAQFVCVDQTISTHGSTASGGSNVACGITANATGAASANVALGALAIASGANSRNVAIGTVALSAGNGSNNIATGWFSDASGDGSNNIATGNTAIASGAGSNNIAIGNSANASGTGTNNTAVGNQSTATGANSSAFGNGASATFANSAAFGNGAVATAANQQVFGTASNSYTMTGLTTTSTAAQSGPLQIVTSDSSGTLGTNTAAGLGLATTSQVNAINSQLGVINQEIGGINARLADLDNRTTKAFNGTAMAFAMAGTPWLLPQERFAVSMDWGTFQGTNGLALNAAMRLGTNVQANGGVAYGLNGGGAGGRAGVRVGF